MSADARVADERVIVVGASVGGGRVATSLRAAGYAGALVMVDPDPDAPYDRPPLSKQVLAGTWPPERAALGDSARWLAQRHVAAAAGLDPMRRILLLDNGTELGYDRLVIASGGSARTLPGVAPAGVHVLRGMADCRALRADLTRIGDGRLVVVGGGFIGAEVAATARGLGVAVTVVEATAAPMIGLLGTRVAEELARLHTDNGVRLLCGVGVAGLVGTPRVTGVALTDGRVLPADVVVVGIGAVPNTGWLAGSGLRTDPSGGVLCDRWCAVDDAGTVYAIGDAARCYDPARGRHVRVEHWTNAVEQADTVAHNILAPDDRVAHRHRPFVWSDQYDMKIQLIGSAEPTAATTVVAGPGPRRRLAAVYHDGETIRAVLTMNWPKALVRARAAMDGGAGVAPLLAELDRLAAPDRISQ